ncbi:autophagy-related protein 17 [Schizophyllum amplum]|uniref:Autophagy-related protein 17 n=1 Tax=Schizophyllum amplum TaxID=97359 RepID=A0A550CJS9_9AGAR|nr:autophagy-related protein 17 [Auriculariopsis ampla]
MSDPATSNEQRHLVSLVLQSKKALQHGEQLCSRARDHSTSSSQSAVDVLAIDAKVRWIADGVLEQLEVAAAVASSIADKRAGIMEQVKAFDASRAQHTGELDQILESLESQLVPPDFHENSEASSLFGSQHSDDDERQHQQSPSDTVRDFRHPPRAVDRRRWKNLRDFVDDRAIDQVLDIMDDERGALDDTLHKTLDYPESLMRSIDSIRSGLPETGAFPAVEEIISSQDAIIHSMAGHLEDLAKHYDQMASALHITEEGHEHTEEEIEQMHMDTDELPSIMTELEECLTAIEELHDRLTTAETDGKAHLVYLRQTLKDLDQLGDIMSEMLVTQDSVQAACVEQLIRLQQRLDPLNQLHDQYCAYQTSFNKLVLEIARRRHYREAAENVVRGMMDQLEAMATEELEVRERFNAEHGANLPEDICLSIGNAPTRWEIGPLAGDAREVLPDIQADIITDARERLSGEVNVLDSL